MKYTINPVPRIFRPVEVTITCESAEELDVLSRKAALVVPKFDDSLDPWKKFKYISGPWADLSTELDRLK